jgi:hypothetical protein
MLEDAACSGLQEVVFRFSQRVCIIAVHLVIDIAPLKYNGGRCVEGRL